MIRTEQRVTRNGPSRVQHEIGDARGGVGTSGLPRALAHRFTLGRILQQPIGLIDGFDG
jgi:hypothetical protein